MFFTTESVFLKYWANMNKYSEIKTFRCYSTMFTDKVKNDKYPCKTL